MINKDEFRKSLVSLSKNYTAQADMEFDDHGKVIKKKPTPGNELGLQNTIVVDREEPPPDPTTLFEEDDHASAKKTQRKQSKKRPGKKKRKR